MVHLAFEFAALVRRRFTERMPSEDWARAVNLRPGCFGVFARSTAAMAAISQRDVAARTGIDASDVVDLVDRLEGAGFLRRERDERIAAATHSCSPRRGTRRSSASRVAGAVEAEVLGTLGPAERARSSSSSSAS